MALLKCPQCGAVVSSNVDSCPKCGCHMSGNNPTGQTESTEFYNGNQGNNVPYSGPAFPRDGAPDNKNQIPNYGNNQYQNPAPNQNSNRGLIYVIIALLAVAVIALIVYLFVFKDKQPQEETEVIEQTVEGVQSSKDLKFDEVEVDNYAYAFADRTRVRANPTKSYENTFDILVIGESVYVSEFYGDWASVRTPKGRYGYVSRDFLISPSLYKALDDHLSRSEIASYKMGKYRKAIATYFYNNPTARYIEKVNNFNRFSGGAEAVVFLVSFPSGQREYVKFGFVGGNEMWSAYSASLASEELNITFDGYNFNF